MKAIRYTLGILLACLALAGCQKVETPQNTIPSVVTGKPVNVSTNGVAFTGTVSSRAECYFLVSASEDMSDARQVEVYPYLGEEGLWRCPMELDGLQPGTTYYVVLCATDGWSEVRGDVVSFTTMDRLHIGSVTYTPWGEDSPVDFVHETPMGSFMFYGDLKGEIWQHNLMIPYSFEYGGWELPEMDDFEGDRAMVVYWPLRDQGDPWSFSVYNGTDYMYGTCEGLNASNLAADIHLNHVMAKVKFDIVLEKDHEMEGTINTVTISNNEDPETHKPYEAIPYVGILDMTVGTLTPEYISYEGAWINCSIKPSADVQSVETFIVPTEFDEGMAYVELWFDNGYSLSTAFPKTSWKSGYEYTYSLTITGNGLRVGDVIVEEWHGNDGGTIIINK